MKRLLCSAGKGVLFYLMNRSVENFHASEQSLNVAGAADMFSLEIFQQDAYIIHGGISRADVPTFGAEQHVISTYCVKRSVRAVKFIAAPNRPIAAMRIVGVVAVNRLRHPGIIFVIGFGVVGVTAADFRLASEFVAGIDRPNARFIFLAAFGVFGRLQVVVFNVVVRRAAVKPVVVGNVLQIETDDCTWVGAFLASTAARP